MEKPILIIAIMTANKVIVVPKDKQAEIALDFDEATKEQLIELVLNDKEFAFLWQEGIFKLINEVSGANIDAFEYDSVTGKENLDRVITALKKHTIQNSKISELIELFEIALRNNTGVYFYF